MIFSSSFGIFVPSKNQPKCFGIFLHGYGASGKNLSVISEYFPFMHCFFPNGLETFEGGGAGYQWFSLAGNWDFLHSPLNFPESIMENSALKTITYLQKGKEWINDCLKKNNTKNSYKNINDFPLIIGGFSQGAALGYHLGFFHYPAIGVIGFSGFYLLKKNPIFKPKTLWIHGIDDDIVSIECQNHGIKNFQNYHIDTQKYTFFGGHNIPKEAGKIAAEKIISFL